MNKYYLLWVWLIAGGLVYGQDGIETIRIWDQAPHNAFTDLVRFRGSFYCCFREAPGHVPRGRSENGAVRILKSKEGRSWENVAILRNEQYDLRDPKLSVTPDKKLMVIMGGSDYTTGKLEGCLAHVSFSRDGRSFTEPIPTRVDQTIKSDYDWIWRVTWNHGTGYGVVYQPVQPDGEFRIRLLGTKDGINYQLISDLDLKGKPNETTIRFDGKHLYMVVRRESQDQNGMLGESDPPYRNWTWHDLGIRLGGPEFILLKSGQILLGTRFYHPAEAGGAKTGIVYLESSGKPGKTIELPSGGDTSYPGMVLFRNKLYMSYYSSHEGKTSVYLAILPI